MQQGNEANIYLPSASNSHNSQALLQPLKPLSSREGGTLSWVTERCSLRPRSFHFLSRRISHTEVPLRIHT